ncbi:SET domain-containing protein-lysine N-methyltransferase [Pseudodesulfovibrio indicus]|nr:SET domain-containing protein-lysine N-methyltransferase [Pseudodesulfovibrio indicus]
MDCNDDFVKFKQLDISDDTSFHQFLESISKDKIFFLNLTAGLDTYKIRQTINEFDSIYIDTACSSIKYKDEYRYSELMPYTYQQVNEHGNTFLMCCGLNPGIIEIMIRFVIFEHFKDSEKIDITIFERDTISTANQFEGNAPVSWSVDTLVDEVVLSPTLEIHNNDLIEASSAPTQIGYISWFGEIIPARLVGHEDIWNLHDLKNIKVRNCVYAYSFSDDVMNILSDKMECAKNHLYLPDSQQELFGNDTIVVKISDADRGVSKVYGWSIDHNETWRKYHINSVQFQVSASVRFFCDLIRESLIEPNNGCNATQLPIQNSLWGKLRQKMHDLSIFWEEIPKDSICLESERVLKSDTGIDVTIKDSDISGIGAYAKQNIQKGAIITSIDGELYSTKEFLDSYDETSDRFVQVGVNEYLGPMKGSKAQQSIDEFLNHSCDPNCAFISYEDGFAFQAIKYIELGEELTWDYSTTINYEDKPVQCMCGSSNCRSQIRAFWELPEKVKVFYLERSYVPNYILELSNYKLTKNPPHDLYINLHTTTSCNLRCKYCYEKRGINRTPTYSKSELKNYLDKVNCTHPTFIFFGGEPLCNIRYITEIIDTYTSEFQGNASFQIQTNGILISKIPIEALNQLEIIHISFDGTCDTISNSRGSEVYHKICESINWLQSVGYKGLVIGRATITEDGDIGKDLLSLYEHFDYIHFQLDSRLDGSEKVFLSKLITGYEILMNRWLEDIDSGTCKKIILPFLSLAMIRKEGVKEKHNYLHCLSGYKGITIDVDGNIFVCPEGAGDNVHGDTAACSMGNIYSDSLTPSLHQPDTRCYVCDLFEVCRGRCRWNSYGIYCDSVRSLVSIVDKYIDTIYLYHMSFSKGTLDKLLYCSEPIP